MKGVIFVNPHSGGGNDVDEYRDRFASSEVVDCEPDELEDQVRAALDADRPFVGVAGGDGSIRCAAEVILEQGAATPLLAVPGGTRNHFAGDLDITDLDIAAKAAENGITRTIDVGQVNGSVFVNNSSIGLYPRLVEQREAREHKLPKSLAAIVAAWHQLRRGHKLRVVIDGTPARVWAVFVGNNCYGDSLLDLGREKLDEGVLDVRIVHAEGRWSRVRVVVSVLLGRVERSPLIDRRCCESVTIDQSVHSTPVALDGEVTTMAPPLRYTSRAKALTVLVSDGRP